MSEERWVPQGKMPVFQTASSAVVNLGPDIEGSPWSLFVPYHGP